MPYLLTFFVYFFPFSWPIANVDAAVTLLFVLKHITISGVARRRKVGGTNFFPKKLKAKKKVTAA